MLQRLLSVLTVVVLFGLLLLFDSCARSCFYRLLPQQPARSVFLHASAPIAPLGSAQSRHGVWRILGPQRELGLQDSGEWLSSNNTAVAPLLSSRGQACSVLYGKRSTRWAHFSCLTSLAMSSCWPSSTLWEKRVSRVLYLSSCSLHTRYVGSGTL